MLIIRIDTLVFGKGPKQKLDDTTIIAEVEYYINFTKTNRKFSRSLHCNGSNIFFIC